jgi:large subunit ribosomal protein L1
MAKEPEAKPAEPEAKTPPPAAEPTPTPAPSVATATAEEGSKKKNRAGKSPPLGKKLKNHLKNVEQRVRASAALPPKQAVAFLKSVKRAKFDETVEVHIDLGIDPTQSDQMVRGSIGLPHGIGKSVRVVVFTQGDNIAKATAAGADAAGAADLIAKVTGGWMDFDVVIATQDMMGQVSRLGKVLGPRGLMPTPKTGTVIPATGDVAATVKEFKAGKVEYRSDKTGQIHAGVGKMSFDDQKLAENITTFVETVRAAKPPGVKGHFIRGVVLSATMCPGIKMAV